MENFLNLEEKWLNSTQAAIDNIKTLLNLPQRSDYLEQNNFVELINWITYTEVSHYDFMPEGYENVKDQAIQYNSFLQKLHHAMLDDGELSFVHVKGYKTFMIFAYPDDDYYKTLLEKQLHVLDNSLRNSYKTMYNMSQKTSNTSLKQSLEKRLETMPKSYKDLEIISHFDVRQFIQDAEEIADNRNKKIEAIEKKRNTSQPTTKII